MNFKEWLLNEMIHMSIPQGMAINGILGDAIDFRFEDWGKGLNPQNGPGQQIPISMKPPINAKAFKARLNDGSWIVYASQQAPATAGSSALKLATQPMLKITRQLMPEEQSAITLPSQWWRFAMVTKGNTVVKAPEWPRGPYEIAATKPVSVRPL